MGKRSKREYAVHVKAKIIFENPQIMPFPIQGIVITNEEKLARTATESAVLKWHEKQSVEYPIKEVRITSTQKLIKDFLMTVE